MSSEQGDIARGDTAGWLGRLRHGLGRSSSKLGGGISGLFTKRRLDDEAVDLERLRGPAQLGELEQATSDVESDGTRHPILGPERRAGATPA